MKENSKEKLTIYLPPELAMKLRIFAVKHRKRISEVIQSALLFYLQHHDLTEDDKKKEQP
ncbi:MAG: hypothetical protein QXQ50_07110 [Candidatus Bathyarchaeia archaeon]